MEISDEGLRLIKSFEGYLTRQKDGSCAAYLCPANVPTIGWGCTEGVKLGMVWTLGEAEAGLRREIAKFEKIVEKHVKVATNQNEKDALISLAYNIGEGGLDENGKVVSRGKDGKPIPGFSTSTVLKRLNKGDRAGAAQAFEYWNKGGGRVLKGLVSRRKREAALFLKPVEAPEEPAMPQAVTEAKPVSKPAIATAAATAAAVAVEAAPSLPIPPVPEAITQGVIQIENWKAIGGQAWNLALFGWQHPVQSLAVAVPLAVLWFWPKSTEAQ